ncbi:MAG TPA: hypothetical protein VN366_07315 [Feifaniaceae bacterium]|nr:hypothetical protein [Feifaniaceae bacterium]
MEQRGYGAGGAAQAYAPAQGGMNTNTTTQEMLLNMIGRYVVCELLVAPGIFYIREGVLLQVAKNFFLLFDESSNTRVACDLHALKFLTVFPPGERPGAMTQEEKRGYLGRLKANQGCRMQALPAPQEAGAQDVSMTPAVRGPSRAADAPALREPYG